MVIVQACVRRWLARLNYRKNRSKAASSAVTLQRHVRGWLTRRRVQVLKEREREHRERLERERRRREEEEQQKREAESRAKIAAAKAKILRKINSQDISPFDIKSDIRKNKENVNMEKAASIIQNRMFYGENILEFTIIIIFLNRLPSVHFAKDPLEP